MRYWLSADFGAAGDATAVCVLERMIIPTGNVRDVLVRQREWPYLMTAEPQEDLTYRLELRYLRALPPHSDYERIAAGIVDRLYKLTNMPRELIFGEKPPTIGLVIDATGVGRGVLHMLRRELRDRDRGPGPRVTLWPVQSTGGNRVTRSGEFMNCPKRMLVHAAYQELTAGRLILGDDAPGREVSHLAEELKNYQMKLNERGHDVYEPWKTGQHDDRLDSLCLACWAWSYQPMPDRLPIGA